MAVKDDMKTYQKTSLITWQQSKNVKLFLTSEDLINTQTDKGE